MSELIADLFISLDGFASGTNEAAFFGYDGPDLSAWVSAELNRRQRILMGRNTYVALAGFSATAGDPASARMRELPKIVYSTTLTGPLTWDNTTVIAGELDEEIRALKRQPGDPIRIFGSIRLVQGLMGLGLVDRLRLMVFPLILGITGKEPIFAPLQRTTLRLAATKELDSRLLLLEYLPAR